MEENISQESQYAGRSMPQAIDAEFYLLGGLLQDPEAFVDIQPLLEPDYFFLERHRLIWRALIELNIRGEPVDFPTVLQELKNKEHLDTIGGKEELLKFFEVPSAANAVYHANIIAEKAILRKLIDSSNKTIRSAMEASALSQDVLQETEARIFEIAERRVRDSLSPASSLLGPLLEKIQNRKQGISGINTGFSRLNELTGGLQKSDLIVLAARPGVGKTSFALSLAINAGITHQATVAFFSLEMSGDQLLQRILSSLSDVSLQKLRSGLLSKEDMGKIQLVCPQIASSQIYIDDNSDLGISELMSKTRKLKRTVGLDLIIVDYLQLMRTNKEENRAVAIGAISRGLKILAKDLQVPVIALAQLNRKVEEKGREGPKLSDLRESGSIEQDADMVWFVEREFRKNEPVDSGKLIIAKHRNGSTDEIPLAFQATTTRFREADPDEFFEEPGGFNGYGDSDFGGI